MSVDILISKLRKLMQYISSEIGCNIDWNYLVKRYYRLRENNFKAIAFK